MSNEESGFYDIKTNILERNVIKALIIAFIILVESATDMYSPSLPIIKKFFHSSEAIMQWTISVNLIGLSVSGIFYGSLSDRFGRRNIMLIGNFVFFLAAILCSLAKNVNLLIVGRFFQGFGGGVALVVGYAIVKDLYDSKECSLVLSNMGMCIAIAPGIAPVLGGYITDLLGWHCIFYLIAIYSFILFVANYFFLRETLLVFPNSQKNSIFSLKNNCLNLLRNFKFICFLLIQAFTFTRVFAESITLPFVYIEGYGISIKYYGLFMLIAIIAYVIGTIINRNLILKLGIKQTLMLGIFLFFSVGFILSMLTLISSLSPLIIEIIKFPGAFSLAFIFSNATTLALNEAENCKGLASSFITVTQTITGVIFSYFLIKCDNGTYLPLAISYLLCGIVSISIFLLTKKLN
jgi:DHA1 family bicyclomycin/chloramphenicol resistance-like MFS transporter